MFGRRGTEDATRPAANPPAAAAAAPATPKQGSAAAVPPPKLAPGPGQTAAPVAIDSHSEDYYQVKTMIFSALIDTIDLAQLAQLEVDSAREEIRDIVN